MPGRDSYEAVAMHAQILHVADAQRRAAAVIALPPLSNCCTHTLRVCQEQKIHFLVVLNQARILDANSPPDLQGHSTSALEHLF